MAGKHTLLPQHQAMIEASAIASEVAAERGYRTVTTKADLGRLGFSVNQRKEPALLVPIWGVSGDEPVNYQIRPDEPRVVKGKALKYETPRGTRIRLDVPPRARQHLGDPTRPLAITEGGRKADAGVSVGLCTISVLGVWNWRGSNQWGGKTVLPDWESIALNGRKVYLVFDSDVMEKRPVYLALSRLKSFLESRGANVFAVYLSAGPGGEKVGLDDFFAAGHNVDDLLHRATSTLKEPVDGWGGSSAYFEKEGATYYRKPAGNDGETVDLQLANFTAQIAGDVTEDDGLETRRAFAIEAQLGKRRTSFEVQAARFGGLNWVLENLGPRAIVSPNQGMRQHLPVAIQTLSEDIEGRRIFTHTGWREVDGELVFLHAGGAIGKNGPVEGIEVRHEPPLDRFVLPVPPTGEERVCAVRESLALLTAGLVQDQTIFPLVAAVYRAPLGGADFTPHVVGKTGARKTEIAALMQLHFGSSMSSDNLPCNWLSTSNSIREVLFRAKDVIAVIDDFLPRGGRQDVRRQHAKADEVLRSVGNRSGRGRMRPDCSLRPDRPPRGLPISTGEEIMTGHSLRARVLIIEVGSNEVDCAVLTERQAAALDYSKAMAAYILWLAPRLRELQEERKLAVARERDRLIASLPHGRTAVIGGELLFALDVLLRFAQAVGAIDGSERDDLAERGRKAILTALSGQVQHHVQAEPTQVFIEMLAGALQAGVAHLADAHRGEVPELGGEVAEDVARLCGWRHATDTYTDDEGRVRTREQWHPGGQLVGYIDVAAEDIYLLPAAAYQVAQRGAEAGSEGVSVGQKTLQRALDEAGLLASKDGGGDRRTKTKRCAGKPRNTLHFKAEVLFGETGTSGTTGTGAAQGAVSGGPFPKPVPEAPVDSAGSGTPNGNEIPVRHPGEGDVPDVPVVPDLEGKRTPGSQVEDASPLPEPAREPAKLYEEVGGTASLGAEPPPLGARIGNIGNAEADEEEVF